LTANFTEWRTHFRKLKTNEANIYGNTEYESDKKCTYIQWTKENFETKKFNTGWKTSPEYTRISVITLTFFIQSLPQFLTSHRYFYIIFITESIILQASAVRCEHRSQSALHEVALQFCAAAKYIKPETPK